MSWLYSSSWANHYNFRGSASSAPYCKALCLCQRTQFLSHKIVVQIESSFGLINLLELLPKPPPLQVKPPLRSTRIVWALIRIHKCGRSIERDTIFYQTNRRRTTFCPPRNAAAIIIQFGLPKAQIRGNRESIVTGRPRMEGENI